MAVRTHRPEVAYGIDDVTLANPRERDEMMNMDEPKAKLSVHSREIESAGHAASAMMRDACLPCSRIPLVRVDDNRSGGAVVEQSRPDDLLRDVRRRLATALKEQSPESIELRGSWRGDRNPRGLGRPMHASEWSGTELPEPKHALRDRIHQSVESNIYVQAPILPGRIPVVIEVWRAQRLT